MSAQSRDVRRLWAIVGPFHLTDTERHDLAMLITGYEGSWAAIPDAAAKQLADGLLCFAAINWLMNERLRDLREAIAAPAPPMPPLAERRAVAS
jgi:hypothetical protein